MLDQELLEHFKVMGGKSDLAIASEFLLCVYA